MRKSNLKSSENTSGVNIGLLLQIKGRVQGVGFRPFIYRLAKQFNLIGSVYNRPDGVIIEIEGSRKECSQFLKDIEEKHPEAAIIKEVKQQFIKTTDRKEFLILPSKKTKDIITEICPDIAICDECLMELNSLERRISYPFINCTNCGPRFTLIQDYPYDRVHTTMNKFEMCPECKAEYYDPLNRRFHAQPTSCFSCGPHYELHWNREIHTDFKNILSRIAENINSGMVVAMKGLGGYNLVCDATNNLAVDQLRKFKKRERKPFALMFHSLDCLKKVSPVSSAETDLLSSWRRPIVILDRHEPANIASGITAGLNSLGVFLPYLPLHHLLFDKIKTEALVVTSGNESDIPIIYQEADALEYFKNISGGILINNREIARRADDSVIRVIDEKPHLMRRARGYVPAPIDLNFSVDGILAAGAELSNAFCLGKQNQAIFSQHIGDLKNLETYEFYLENIESFKRMYRFTPLHIACDLHPDYLSTLFASETALPVSKIQHHHAHVATVMAESGLDSQVIGLAYDGTGFGTDGNIWGSELLVSDFNDFNRESHFEYVPLPGGDLVTKEPWRTGLSYLYKSFGNDWNKLDIPFLRSIDLKKSNRLIDAIEKGINCPLSSSAGRLFDAIAAILGICTMSNYHAEAPMMLENFLKKGIEDEYAFSGSNIVSFSPMVKAMVKDVQEKKSLFEIVTKFHNTVARVALNQVEVASKKYNNRKVVLSGGTFQNKYLTEKLLLLLRQNEFETYFPGEVSCNDGGIGLGQMAIAAHKK